MQKDDVPSLNPDGALVSSFIDQFNSFQNRNLLLWVLCKSLTERRMRKLLTLHRSIITLDIIIITRCVLIID